MCKKQKKGSEIAIMYDFSKTRKSVLQQIETACLHAQRKFEDVELLAVSKTQPSDILRAMYTTGQRCFGENYLQEALQKIEDLKDLEIQWHFIGHVQRNKTKHLAENFAWVQGVDRLIIAERLSKQREGHKQPLNVCIQVNIDNQNSKDGCTVAELPELVKKISILPNLQLRGLMVIPDPQNQHAFVEAKQLFEKVRKEHQTAHLWDTLSMGMSGDLDKAIEAGSTMVRIGTALFGQRDYTH